MDNIYEDPGFFSITPYSSQISAVYDNVEELAALLVTFFKQGIEKGEYCLWISPDNLTAQGAKSELKKSGIDVDHYLVSSQFEILQANPLSENVALFTSSVKELAEKGYQKTVSGKFSGFRMNLDFKNTKNNLIKPYLEMCRKTFEEMGFENNESFTLLCTFPLEELSGRTILELINENDIFVKRDGKWKLSRTFEENGMEDIFYQAEMELEVTNWIKNGLLINMSHELRTPLNSIIGFSDLLLEGAFGSLNTRQSKYVNNILISGKNLLEIINTLLDVSRFEAGERSLNYENVDLAGLIGEIRMNLLSFASNKKISVEVQIDSSLESIRADRTKLRQVLYNLMNNAIKFTPEKGRVNISAIQKEGLVEVKVSDSSIGFLKEDHERVLSFIQSDLSTARRYGGAGLGLFIAKNFIDLHGGKIWVESNVEKGNAFIFTLPLN